MRSCTRLLLLVVLALCPQAAQGLDLRGTLWDQAASSHELDPLLLYAVALMESGRTVRDGAMLPWPWALHINGRGAVFAPNRAAAGTVLQENAGTSNIDIGLLQINARWHGDRVGDPADLLDPRTNLAIGAELLREALKSAPGDLALGIGRYHNQDEVRARAYGETVLGIYRFLLHWQEE